MKNVAPRWRRLLGSCGLAGALAATSSLAMAVEEPLFLSPKQLAAPPSDFIGEDAVLHPPDPAASGQRARSAMIPMHFKPAGDEWTWEMDVPVDSWDGQAIIYFAGPDAINWDISFQAPGETALDRSALSARSDITRSVSPLDAFGLEIPALEAFGFRSAVPGMWRATARSRAVRPRQANDSTPDGYLVVAVESPFMLYTHFADRDHLVGNDLTILATMFDNNVLRSERDGEDECSFSGVRGAASRSMNGALAKAKATVKLPDGSSRVVALFDDGRHNDEAAGDGLFGGTMTLEQTGDHLVHVEAEGRLPDGLPFVRTTMDIVPVIERKVVLAGSVSSAPEDDSRLRVDFPVTLNGEVEKVQLVGEFWGHDARGAETPICWLGAMARPWTNENGQTVVSWSVDSRWIDLAQAQGPFELRNVRGQDPDTFVPWFRFEQASLAVDALPARAGAEPIARATWDMMESPVPAVRQIPASPALQAFADQYKAKIIAEEQELAEGNPRENGTNFTGLERASHSLLLVHGYCSGIVWGLVGDDWPENVLATFTENKALFEDYNQNRSHDQFAQRVFAVGRNLKSFGIVAHSQGGCASTHLLTFYYSGLQWGREGGSRAIQSVGTPYQGTALAGNLAAIGDVFGQGCGSNTNLTYSGADAWMATIPSGHRSFVWPHTTGYADDYFANDFCSLGTDGFLFDPEDGVTEHICGQLPGSHQQALVTGQCHTASFADPPQYGTKRRLDDSSINNGTIVTYNRNATMSSSARR